MKNLIKSRRGIAIEMAVGAMLIMMALSIVLISISGMQNQHRKSDLEDFAEKIEVYEITDYILKNHMLNAPVETIDDSGVYTVDCNPSDDSNYTYTILKDNNVILTLEINTVIDGNTTKNTITSWRD